ncbi:hypothetical protein Tco_1047709 [Tanacetum coccineum]
MLDKIWEYCKDVHRDNTYWRHDHGFEKEECDEIKIEIEKYYPPEVQVETFDVPADRRQLSRPTRPKPSRDSTRPLGPPIGLKGLLHMLNATVIPTKGKMSFAHDGDFLDFSTGLLHFILSEAMLKGVSCSNSTLPLYLISLMYNKDIVQNKWGDGSRIIT